MPLLCSDGFPALMQTIRLALQEPWHSHMRQCEQCRRAQPTVLELVRIAEGEAVRDFTKALD